MSDFSFRECFRFKPNVKSIFVRKGQRYLALDGIRAISIMIILPFHCLYLMLGFQMDEPAFREFHDTVPIWLQWILNASFSVDMFFVLSGFLIGNILLREYRKSSTINIKRFYLRRLFRLYPVYLFLILISALTLGPHVDTSYLWYNVFHLVNFLPYEKMLVLWTWTLSVEEQFYLLFPLCLLIAFRFFSRPLVFLCGLFLLSFAIRALVLAQHPEFMTIDMFKVVYPKVDGFTGMYFSQLYDNLYTRFGCLIIGSIAAYLHVVHSDVMERILLNAVTNTVLVLLSILGLFTVFSLPMMSPDSSITGEVRYWYFLLSRNLFGFCLSVLLLCMIYPAGILTNAIARVLSAKFWFPIAQLSYSIYLLHMPMAAISAAVVFQLAGGLSGFEPYHLVYAMLLCAFLAAIPAIFSFAFLEAPFMRMRGVIEGKSAESKLAEAS